MDCGSRPITMPFGRHRGQALADVPSRYLAWVLRECIDLDAALRDAIRQEFAGRSDAGRYKTTPRPAAPTVAGGAPLAAVIREWYRQLCLTYHPDRGGSTEAMQAINEARDRLVKLIGAGHLARS